jgi:hypothetical protein
MTPTTISSTLPVARLSRAKPAAPAGWTQATIAGIRVIALVEVAALLLLALMIDHFWQANRFAGVEPHPFLLIVVIAAAHYGLGEGLIAAAAASLALRVGNLPPPAAGADGYDFLWACVAQPLSWVALAVAVGILRNYHLGRQRRIEEQLSDSLRRERDIAAGFDHVRRAKNRLQEAVAAHLRSVVTLYKAAQHVERLDPLDVLGGARGLISAGLGPEKFSLYLLDGRRLVCVLRQGHAPGEGVWAYEESSPLFQHVVARRLTACVARPAEAELLGGSGVLAGPLLSEHTGAVVGMLKIDQTGFLALNMAAVQNFEVLCRWLGTAFTRAQEHVDGHVSAFFNASTQMLSYAMFEQQALFLTRLARRLQFNLSTVAVQFESVERLAEAERAVLAQALGHSVRSVLRATDLAFEATSAEGGSGYTILLPNTSVAGAGVVAQKLKAELERRLQSAAARRSFALRIEPLHTAGDASDHSAEVTASDVSRLRATLSQARRPEPLPASEVPLG